MTNPSEPPAPTGGGDDDGAWAPTESHAASTAPTLLLDASGDVAPPAAAAPPASAEAAAAPAATVDRERELLAGQPRFRIERLLGEGGMGKVYLAFDTVLARPVALKVLFASDREADERFEREARAQARVDHPHVCKVYETGAIAGRRYIVMQYVEGASLGHAVEGAGLERKVRVLRQVCEGVHAAHRIGLVHRDIKPSNVLVTTDDNGDFHPYVMDFGIARDLQAGRTATSAVVGTPWYMAPEQVAGGEVDRRTDVYALGVTLYQLLTGKLPITGTGSVDVLVRVLHEEPVPLARVDPRLPVDLQTVVMKCLEKDPARRYDSARALADDLGRYLEGEPVAARPATFAYRWAKRIRRNRLAWAIGTAGAIAALAIAALAAREAWLARRLESDAASFAIEAERFEWILRAERQMPLHDTRPLEARLRERLANLAAEVPNLPPATRGHGYYAVGRGALALGEIAQADRLLDLAWANGSRAPVVAYWRGRAKVEMLRSALESARRIADRDLRRSTIAAVRARYRDAAVDSLAAGQAAPVLSQAYSRALLDWAEGRFEDAATGGHEQLAVAPFLYEAWLLIGDAAVELAHREEAGAADSGALERAVRAFGRAAAIGASDPRPHQRLCSLELMRAAAPGASAPAREHLELAARHCANALVADASDAAAVEADAEVHRQLAGLDGTAGGG
jgi:serine/threonine-protein kinase